MQLRNEKHDNKTGRKKEWNETQHENERKKARRSDAPRRQQQQQKDAVDGTKDSFPVNGRALQTELE